MITKATFNKAVIQRTRDARKAAELTQEEVALALGITQGLYKTYETCTPIPLYLLERFAIITRSEPAWIAFGNKRP